MLNTREIVAVLLTLVVASCSPSVPPVPPSLNNLPGITFYHNREIFQPIQIINVGSQLSATDPCTLDKPLPAGLKLDVSANNINCQISGTPTELSPDTAYILTARNSQGTDTAMISLAVNDNPLQISTSADHSCAVSQTGRLYCWGRNAYQQLSQPLSARRAIGPVRVGSDTDWERVATGLDHTCALKAETQLYCWGRNTAGQLGLGNTVTSVVARVGADEEWSYVSAGNRHTCAAFPFGVISCWGDGQLGQLGLGNTSSFLEPQQLSFVGSLSRVDVGAEHGCALLFGAVIDESNQEVTLLCWGNNSSGQLGLGNKITQNMPTQVGTAKDWSSLSAGAQHTCAINQFSELYCWGDNSSGQLGLGEVAPSVDLSTPQQVVSELGWQSVSAGDNHTCAINNEHQLHCWGSNSRGQLGLGDIAMATSLSPTIVSDGFWTSVSAGATHTCAIGGFAGGFCWGDNTYDQLGIVLESEDGQAAVDMVNVPVSISFTVQ